MTCYLRLHEVLLGVGTSAPTVNWPAAFDAWQRATTVADRDQIVSAMALEPVDAYDLPKTDLGKFGGLIVSGRVDQEFLYQERDVIGRFLNGGGVLVFSGELLRPWLPGAGPFAPAEAGSIGAEPSLMIAPHPIFAGLGPEDLGSSFVHGHHRAPDGAEVLASLSGGRPVVYIDRRSSGGTVLVHAGHTLLGYAAREAPARWIVPRLLDWMSREGR